MNESEIQDLENGLRHAADDHPCCKETLTNAADALNRLQRLEKQLNHAHPSWNVYITASRKWAITLKKNVTIISLDLMDAMQKAIDYVHLPEAPPRPAPRNQDDFKVEKNGNIWRVIYRGYFEFDTKTKKEAQSAIDARIAANCKAIDEWDSTWGHMQEGVDYVFKK